jgi:hypothetical protein
LIIVKGPVAEWLGKGLQNPVQRFKSAPDLKKITPGWWNWHTRGT